ncbi:MAG TPA: MinD/ParA family protein [Mycobacterium sp.]|nr:MinD/ParA family protein [Mycobacterium sp.]
MAQSDRTPPRPWSTPTGPPDTHSASELSADAVTHRPESQSPPQAWSASPPEQRHDPLHEQPVERPAPLSPPRQQLPPRPSASGEDTHVFSVRPDTTAPPTWRPAPRHESTSAGLQTSAGRSTRPGTSAPPGWGNYVESIQSSDLVPSRTVPPARGWRRALFTGTFGLINLGQSPDERRQAQLETAVRTLLRGNYKIGVLGKGGVGKTSVAVSVGSILAQLRQDDRVVAIDADTAFGRLGSRVDPHAQGSFWELVTDDHLETFADVRTRVGNNASGLFVLPGEGATARRRVLDPAIYREAVSRLDRHFTISIVDCGSTIDAPVTQEALRDLDALIVVSSPWVDGASAAGQTLDYLHNQGMTKLLHHTVIVLNDSDGHAKTRTRSVLAQQFASHGQPVFEVPFDPHLRPGGVIDVQHGMSPKTRRKFLEITAAIAEQFAETTRASRPH